MVLQMEQAEPGHIPKRSFFQTRERVFRLDETPRHRKKPKTRGLGPSHPRPRDSPRSSPESPGRGPYFSRPSPFDEISQFFA